MASLACNNFPKFKNVVLVDENENVFKFAVPSEDYDKIIKDPIFAAACLEKAKEIGVTPETNEPPIVGLNYEFDEDNGAVDVLPKKWTKSCVLLLIDSFHTYKEELDNSREKRMFGERLDECDAKWRNLKASYKKIKDKASKTGHGKQNWEFYDQMDQVLCNEHSIVPVNLLFSSKSASVSDLPNMEQDVTEDNSRRPLSQARSTSNLRDISISKTSISSFEDDFRNSPRSLSHASSTPQLRESSSTSSINTVYENNEETILHKSKKRKLKSSEGPEWFLKWAEENKKMEEQSLEQTKHYQEAILKRLDTRNVALDKIADIFSKM